MKKMTGFAVGTAFAASVASGAASAVENPFEINQLENGYQVAYSSLPEGSCGAKDSEGKCGGDKSAKEAKCGAN